MASSTNKLSPLERRIRRHYTRAFPRAGATCAYAVVNGYTFAADLFYRKDDAAKYRDSLAVALAKLVKAEGGKDE